MPGNLGMTIVRYLYQQGFTYGDLGFGSAIGFVLLGIVLVINLIQLKGFGLFRDDDRGIENEKNDNTVCGENFVSPAGSDDAFSHIFYGDCFFKAYQCTF